jgi:hypothetical protein
LPKDIASSRKKYIAQFVSYQHTGNTNIGLSRLYVRPSNKQLTRIIIITIIIFWWGSLRERHHWGDPDVDGRIILRGIFR